MYMITRDCNVQRRSLMADLRRARHHGRRLRSFALELLRSLMAWSGSAITAGIGVRAGKYDPEAHYMRGPGPMTRAKQKQTSSPATAP